MIIQLDDRDLETVLRKVSTEHGYPLTAVCRGLLRLGLKAKPSAVRDEIVKCVRPLGRPPVSTPRMEPEKDQKKKKPGAAQGWDLD